MTSERDTELGTALSGLTTPTASDEFWVAVNAEFDTKVRLESNPQAASNDVYEVLDLPSPGGDQDPKLRVRVIWLAATAVLLIVTFIGVKRLSGPDVPTTEPTGVSTPNDSSPELPDPQSNTTAETQRESVDEEAGLAFELAVRNMTYPSEWSDTGQITLTDGVWTDGPADNPHTEVRVWMSSSDLLAPYSVVLMSGEGRGTGVFSDLYYVEPETPGTYAPGDPLNVSQQVPIGRDIGDPQLSGGSSEVRIDYMTFDGSDAYWRFEVKEGFLGEVQFDQGEEATAGALESSSEAEETKPQLDLGELARTLTYPSDRSRTGEITMVDGIWLTQEQDAFDTVSVTVEGALSSERHGVQLLRIESASGEVTTDFYSVTHLGGNNFYVSDPVTLPGAPAPAGINLNRDSVEYVYRTETGGMYYFKFFLLEGELVPAEPPSWMGDPELKSEILCWIIVEGDVKARFGVPEDLLLACHGSEYLSVDDVFPGAERLGTLGSFEVFSVP